MAFQVDDKLVIGVSSRALFDLQEENRIFEEQGLAAYEMYQREHENVLLKPGAAFPLVKALHNLNLGDRQLTEIVIMSKNSTDTSMRIFNSIEHYGLDITRAALVGGGTITPYLSAFGTDLFLSANEADVQEALQSGIAAGLLCPQDKLNVDPEAAIHQIRIAFDGDAVIFSGESEEIFQKDGLEAFAEHERQNAQNPLPEGPFAKLLKTISLVQSQFDQKQSPIRTALVTARNAPAHERVIRTLRAWDVRVDETFFLGGMKKTDILKAFGAHIFFDDQQKHIEDAAEVVPAAKVPAAKVPAAKK